MNQQLMKLSMAALLEAQGDVSAALRVAIEACAEIAATYPLPPEIANRSDMAAVADKWGAAIANQIRGLLELEKDKQ